MRLLRVIALRSLLPGLLLAALPASASAPLDGLLLGSSEAELQARFDSLVRMRRPVPGPNGLRGLWALPDTPISGLPFQTTFYVKDKRISRIEQRWTSNPDKCSDASVFAAVVADIGTRYGSGLMAQDGGDGDGMRQSVVWQSEAFDTMAYELQSATECSILVIYKPHVIKDASEL
ncbi:MAG: hypothetical protein HY068_07560 [Burkholderiales bacterium]|nr:hypothetical protein [Burkholderiales bacterium]